VKGIDFVWLTIDLLRMQSFWKKYSLNFKHPAQTSRSIMRQRDIWFLFLSRDGITGIGECAPLNGLSIDNIDQIESRLNQICANPKKYINNPSELEFFPSLCFALEMAVLDLENGGTGQFFPSLDKFTVNINGLIWMGDANFMLEQIDQKLSEGYRCIKIKIGGLDFDKELEILQYIRQHHGPETLELRLDANGAFSENNVQQRLAQLAKFLPHSIEQPIAIGQWDLLAKICQSSPIPIALDEELLPLVSVEEQRQMLDRIQPQYIVLKPGLLGGFKASNRWIKLAEERNIGWWVTSALESNMGLNAISQWTESLYPEGFQGLGTGQLFNNNLPSPLGINAGKLTHQTAPIWNDIHRFMLDWLHPSSKVNLQTSGSTGAPRTISMNKSWMKASARLTAEKLGLNSGDSALLCLPLQFVAGKMMLVRTMSLNLDLKVIEPTSNPLVNISEDIDFVAMTPMQLSNSVTHGQLDRIKTIIVGGAQVNSILIETIQSQKTHIFETWGMTETASHIALRPLNGPEKSDCFTTLPGVSLSKNERGCLIIQADHLGGKPIITTDVVELLSDHSFRWLGRYDNVINTGGVKILPEVVEKKLASHISDREFFIDKTNDAILGQKVILFIEGKPFELPEETWTSLTKFEKPEKIHFIAKFMRTDSGKIIRNPSRLFSDRI